MTVNGSPMPSRRPASAGLRDTCRRSSEDASTKSIIPSAACRKRTSSSLSGLSPTRPSTGPASSPRPAKKSGVETTEVARRAETRA